MLYAYDPFRRYGIKDHHAIGRGDQLIDINGFTLLDSLAEHALTGHAAIRAVTEYVRLLTPKSGKLFIMILDKNFKMGMAAKTINAEFPGWIPEHPVMLAKLYKPEKVKWPALICPKIDGVRGIYRNGKLFTRNGHRLKGLEHIENSLRGYNEDFDGELDIPGKSFQEASGLIRAHTTTPDVVFNVFDVPSISEPFYIRLTAMEDMNLVNGITKLVPHMRTVDENAAYRQYSACRNMGYEGAIIKSMDHFYENKRSWHWQKLKNTSSLDLPVMDIFEGTSKYKGMLGGVKVLYHSKYVKVGSGFTDEERQRYWEDPYAIVNKIVEVLYQEETRDGSLRHPRFAGIRSDKDRGEEQYD